MERRAASILESRVTFIGGGNMATAIIQGLVTAGMTPDRIQVAEPVDASRDRLTERFGIRAASDNRAMVRHSDVVVVAVKPALVPGVLREIGAHLEAGALLISIAAGVALKTLEAGLSPGQPVVRAMPNTPALIGSGVSVLCAGSTVDPGKLERAEALLGAVGEVRSVSDESLMDGVTALSGSGPAYLYLIVEALSDGGVACGLPRDLADWLAVNTMRGAADLVAQSGEHPGALKNRVTSPAGTTIAALRVLEDGAVRGRLMAAVEAAWNRSRTLSSG